MVIHAHAACSLIDVIDGLRHRIASVEYATVEIEVEMAEKAPKVFTSVNMKYIIKGDVPEALVRRLIESSHEMYCRIGIMITRSGATLEWTLDMLD
jgi:putative redox protein